jgi:putative copper resistance protein D
MSAMSGMPTMPHGPGAHGMSGMYAPPADTHSLLTAWPVSVPGVLALALAVWTGHRALVLWRPRETPRSPSLWNYAAVSLMAAVAGVAWVATAAHNSPFAYVMVAVEVTAAVFYLSGVRRLAAKGRRWPAFRIWMFVSGLVAVGLALESPVSTLVATSFPYHVIQHMLLMVLAAPLLALSAPMTLALQTTNRHTKKVLLTILNSVPFGVLTFPVVIWFLYYGVMFVFFLTPLLGYAMNHMALMDTLNLLFLFGACNFWWPTVGADDNPRWKMTHGFRIINLLIGVPFESFLGIALLGGAAAASMYTTAGTHIGGGMVWAIGELSAFAGTTIVMIQWARDDGRVAAREDRRTAARQRADAARTSPPSPPGAVAPAAASVSAGSAFEEAYLLRGVPVPVTLSDDYRG